jgi:cell filamentation protein
LGLNDDDVLLKAEREITSIKLLMLYNFIKRLAYYMGEVNALHPFREGNGRTSREYFRQLSLNGNYILDFSKINKDDLLTADIEAFNGSYDNLIKILDKAVIVK